MTGLTVPFTMESVLLNNWEEDQMTAIEKEQCSTLLTLAKNVIAKHWKSTSDLCIEWWYESTGIWECFAMEKLTYKLENVVGVTSTTKFVNKWFEILSYLQTKKVISHRYDFCDFNTF